jgi:hypothetical protein
MNGLAAAVLAAGELICEFHDGYRRNVIAELMGDAPRADLMLVYEALTQESAEVLSTRQPGRNPVSVRATGNAVHLIQADGPSVRVTTITGCSKWKMKRGEEQCMRFEARHAWHFNARALANPDAVFARLPSGAATGACEPWSLGTDPDFSP